MNSEERDGLVESCRDSNFSMEHLFASLYQARNRVAALRSRAEKDERFPEVLDRCAANLDRVEAAICPKRPFGRKSVFFAWSLLHRTSEDLVLLYDRPELMAEARSLVDAFKSAPIPDAIRTDWLVRLEEAGKALKGAGADPEDRGQLRIFAELFRVAWSVVNGHVDDKFWDIWSKRFLSLIYTALLTVLLLILVFSCFCGDLQVQCYVAASLLGAMGGLASGVLSGEQEYYAKGHFWIPTFYYVLVRPVLGAVAGLVMLWMLSAQFLFSVQPPLPAKGSSVKAGSGLCTPSPSSLPSATPSSAASLRPTAPATAEPSNPPTPSDSMRAASSGAGKPSGTSGPSTSPSPGPSATPAPTPAEQGFIVLRSTERGAPYLWALLLFLAGFSGDKLLKAVSDRVMSKLFAEAEKTKELPK